MKTNPFQMDRRSFLAAASAGLLGSISLPGMIRSVLAMGERDVPQGIREINGDVSINGKPAQIGMIIAPGDVVKTGHAPSRAVFVVGRDAYLLREKTEILVAASASGADSESRVSDLLRIINGKVLAVFKKGNRQIVTPTATVGIRGTGIYIEIDPAKDYICTCYGSFEIRCNANPDIYKQLTSHHHEYPQYIFADGPAERSIVHAPMKNHTDAELIMLEALVDRKPPFLKKKIKRKGYDDDGGNREY